MPELYHFTCDHGARGIVSAGSVLRPGLDGLVWLADLARAQRAALGLTSHMLECDRTAYRFTAMNTAGCLPWWRYRRTLAGADLAAAYALEAAPGARPAHWWVSSGEVPAMLSGGREVLA